MQNGLAAKLLHVHSERVYWLDGAQGGVSEAPRGNSHRNILKTLRARQDEIDCEAPSATAYTPCEEVDFNAKYSLFSCRRSEDSADS